MLENVFLNFAKTGRNCEFLNSKSLSIAKLVTPYQVERNRIEENFLPNTKHENSIASLGGVE